MTDASETDARGHRNRLASETSPYLLQHADNPVDWYPWGEEAFERARDEDKPLLLSVGYSSCHWCHVMAHESFEDESIAALMNEAFVSVKVDREERPDVDSVYMTATQALTGSGGWPMTVFLTPDGQPFYAGTYFPPDDQHGRPGFRRVLTALRDLWTSDRDRVVGSAADITERLQAAVARQYAGEDGERDVSVALAAEAVESLWRSYDEEWGGFGRAPKFPNPGGLEFLLMHEARLRGEGAAPGSAWPDGPLHAAGDGRGRHVRPARRRLRALQRRSPVAGPALREDALRQRPARARLPARLPAQRRRGLRADRARDARLRRARDAPRGGRLLQRAGRRQRGH